MNGAAWPAGIVIGRVSPDTTNWPLPTPSDDTVTDVPVAARLPARETLDPTVTFPKFSVAGETDRTPGLVPVPESATLSGEFAASETTARMPLAEPAAAGVKVAVKLTLWAGARVMGKVSPEMENPAETFACEIVTGDPPVFVNASHRLAVLPTCTLPKARLLGFALSVPGEDPEIAIVYFAVAMWPPLPLTVMLNAYEPAVAGVPERSADRVSPDGDIPIPGGRLPADTVQVKGTAPSLVLMVAE